MTVLAISVSSNGVLQIREDTGRRTLAPGSVIEGVWVDTDTSGEPQSVQDKATEAWTTEVVATYRAAAEATEAEAAARTVAPHLNYGGLLRFTGPASPSVLENIGMAGVTRVSKGRYRVTHATAMPSDQYSALVSVMDANPRGIRITARTASYVEVRVTDLAGLVQDPAEITVKTERVV